MLKGKGLMFVIAASSIATLACQGCATGSTGSIVDSGVSELAEPSEGIQLAAPAPLGTSEVSALEAADINLSQDTILPEATTLFSAALPSGQLPEDGEPAITLSMMANTAAATLPTTEWSKTLAVELIAARQNLESLVTPTANEDDKDFSAEFTLDAPSEITGFGFDLGVVPRLAYREDGELRSRSFGGEVRIGQNFDKRGEGTPASWYIFAGADGEALTFEPGEGGLDFSSESVSLRDQVTVGDMQAGVSVQRGPGQLSLSYIRREVSYRERGMGANENEDFAGVSFTLKR